MTPNGQTGFLAPDYERIIIFRYVMVFNIIAFAGFTNKHAAQLENDYEWLGIFYFLKIFKLQK